MEAPDEFCVTFVVTPKLESAVLTPSTYRAMFRGAECDADLACALRYMRDSRFLEVHLQVERRKPYRQAEWKTLVALLEKSLPEELDEDAADEDDDDDDDDEQDDFAQPAKKCVKLTGPGCERYFQTITRTLFAPERNLTVCEDGESIRMVAPLETKPGVYYMYVFVDYEHE
jgi:hypothetical protein